jgi:glycosyltransferase involved in cell wall biosynthesis
MTENMRRDNRTHVLLVRDMPEQRLASMERLADEIERGFAGHARYRVTAAALHASRMAARVGLGRVDSCVTRFVRYPIALRRTRADLYHVIDHGYAHAAALLPRERTVIECHDLMLLKAEEGVAGFTPGRVQLARFRWSTSYLKKVARVICPSESTMRDLVRLRGVSPERISVVPQGVDACFRPLAEDARERLKAALPGAPRRVMLHVSTGDAYKNVAGTLRVLAALRESEIDITLLRIGKPRNEIERRLTAELGVEGAVIECGRVPEDRLVELYNAADVLLFPSFYEGYGWPPLEAMACGTPVVVSDAPSLAEVVGDAGLAAPARDVAALAAAVRSIVETPELADTLRRRGIERAAGFTWRRTIDGFARAYELVGEAALARDEGSRSCAA